MVSLVAVVVVAVAVAVGWLLGAWTVRRRLRRRLTALIAKISHELRTPLTAVIGLLGALNDEGMALGEEERRELLAMAEREAERLQRLIENLYSGSRLARGVLEATPVGVPLGDFVERALGRFPDVERRAYLQCESELAVRADPNFLAQILNNLLQNTDRYAPDGGVEIRCRRVDDVVEVRVADDGPGIRAGERERIFRTGRGGLGLGLGLGLSRELARAMGGELTVAEPLRSGATFLLTLPVAETVDDPAVVSAAGAGAEPALPPRARLLVEMAAVLEERSVDRMVARLHGLSAELLGADRGILLARDRDGRFSRAGSFGSDGDRAVPTDDPRVVHVVEERRPLLIPDTAAIDDWEAIMGGGSVLLLPVLSAGEVAGLLALGWHDPRGDPGPRVSRVAEALANLAGFALDRSHLVQDAAYERTLRASVMESLPIAISIFAGDPPRVVDWNRRERELLGITADEERPSELAASQERFDVRFADGTPLTVENAPVTRAIRTGEALGPFLLRLRRRDGEEVVTRTYCAPFFDDHGTVAGAVVTSEAIDVLPPPGDQPKR